MRPLDVHVFAGPGCRVYLAAADKYCALMLARVVCPGLAYEGIL